LAAVILTFTLAACGGGGGGGDDVVIDDTPPPPTGSGTGAGGVPVFFKVLAYNQGYGRSNAVVELEDGSLVSAGFQSVSGAPNDVFVAKTDRAGTVLWEKRLPVSGGAIAHALRPLAAGGFMLAGTIGDGAAARGFMLRIDAQGNAVSGWPRTFGEAGTQVLTMIALGGGNDGFMLAGVSGPSPYVARVDAAGSLVWTKNNYAAFCPGGGAMATTIVPTSDGRYILGGRTGCFEWAATLMKIDANGNELWRKTFDDGVPSRYAGFDALVETPDGGLLAAGRVGETCLPGEKVGDCDVLLIKTDATGAALWTRRYGGANIDGANGLALAADGNYLVGATTRSYGGTITDEAAAVMWDDLFLIKVTPDGSTVWQKVKGVRPRALDATMGMARTADGGFVIAGEAGGNPLLVKFDRDGATAVLQKDDLTISLPATTGAINFDNAVDVAGLGAGALLLPGQVGGELLDLLIAASSGESPADYCTGGGSYRFEPAVPATLVAGASYTLSFDQCTAGPAGDRLRIRGSARLTLTSVSGVPGSSDYLVILLATDIALAVDEPDSTPLLSQSFAGSLGLQRGVAVGNRSEVVNSPAGTTLAITDLSGWTVTANATLGPFTIRSTLSAAGAARAATAGDSATLVIGGQTLAVNVSQAIDLGATTLEPTAGIYRVSATDGSRVTVALSASGDTSTATLAIDADGDGRDDGNVSVPWEFIF